MTDVAPHPGAPGVPVGAADPVAASVRDVRLVGLLAAGFVAVGSVHDLGVLCPLRRTTGIPCPLCGLTTGVEAAATGDVVAAVHAHPLAPVALGLLVAVWTPLGPTVMATLRRHPAVVAAVLALVWAARLVGVVGP